MKFSKDQLEKTLESEDLEIREGLAGEIHIGWEIYKKEFDIGPYLKGLPNDLCQCPHWGYILQGGIKVSYGDGAREELCSGEVYYIKPGHTGVVEAGTELVEFSPKDEFQKTMEVAAKNFEAEVAAQKA